MNSSYNNNTLVLEDEGHSELALEENSIHTVTDEEVFFAKQRFKLYQSMPDEGVDIDILKKYFFKKYGY